MRRAIVTTSATVSGIVLLLGLKPHGGTVASGQTRSFSIGSGSDSGQAAQSGSTGGSGTTSGGTSGGGSSSGTAPSTTAPDQAAPTTTAPKSSGATTKAVTGDAIDTRYGPIQLRVTFTGKKITKIDVLQYPTESGRDLEINSYALPVLNQEAMAAQSAQIDAVSGATYTSDGYTRSLQSAIDKLGA